MNGIIFCGCSFTWGQGLYYYSELKTIVEPPEYTFEWDLVSPAHKRYMYANRWARLVANHFDTFEIVKNSNGGQESQSLEFLDTIFHRSVNSQPRLDTPFYLNEDYDYSEISYIILQTSIPIRNCFCFKLNGKKYKYELGDPDPRVQNLLFDFMKQNNVVDSDALYDLLIQQQFENLVNAFQFYESKGVKCRILCWQDQYLEYIKENQWMLDRFIKMEYDGVAYDSIYQMALKNKHLWIKTDHQYFGDNPPKDHHPSKECHKVVADAIIKKINLDLGNVEK
jgi:hypothetical protein